MSSARPFALALVIDDDADILVAAQMLLRDLFDEVVTAPSPDAAMTTVVRSPDVILLDINMPRMDGISLTKKLRENPKFKTTPILILTTESSDAMKQAGRAAGATGWLVKPFDPAKLIEVIGKVIR